MKKQHIKMIKKKNNRNMIKSTMESEKCQKLKKIECIRTQTRKISKNISHKHYFKRIHEKGTNKNEKATHK